MIIYQDLANHVSFFHVVDGFIQNHTESVNSDVGVKKNEALLWIKDLELTPNNISDRSRGPFFSSVIDGTCYFAGWHIDLLGKPPPSTLMDYPDFRENLRLYKTEGRVQGKLFLAKNSRLIWISNSDLRYFKRIETL